MLKGDFQISAESPRQNQLVLRLPLDTYSEVLTFFFRTIAISLPILSREDHQEDQGVLSFPAWKAK